MARNKDIDDLIKSLNKDIVRIMDNKGKKEIKEVYKEEVENMYEEYDALYYTRRYDDYGFLDERNWITDVKLKNNGVEFTLVNDAEAVNSNIRLDKIIEQGIYDWNRKPPKRPVYERTSFRLKSEQVVENTLESELKKKGWKFE